MSGYLMQPILFIRTYDRIDAVNTSVWKEDLSVDD